jgi:DNA polymerase-3 subunit epsilon
MIIDYNTQAVAEPEALARALERDENYRVLRRLALPALAPFDLSTPIFRGLFVDCETTGLEIEQGAKAIEIAMLPFQWAAVPTGAMFASFESPIRMLCDPGEPIPPAMTAIHGLTDADVAGQSWDVVKIGEVFSAGVDLVVSHHANFDREFLEKASAHFESANWGCSAEQVPWADHGFSGRKLEYVLAKLGRFYDAHHAVDDCIAGVFALSAAIGTTTGLQHVINATKRRTWHVRLNDLKFNAERNVKLKERGYRWDGASKSWHRALPWDGQEAEADWLRANVYRVSPMPVDWLEVTARDRFTKRGGK